MKVISVEETRILEKSICEKFNIPPILLMENAGSFVYYFLKENFKDLKNKKIGILCGPGNNGGDALVVARYLYINGISPYIFTYSWEKGLSPLCQLQYDLLKETHIKFFELEKEWKKLEDIDLIIDGIFGIGLKRPLEEKLREIITDINNLNKKIIAIDVPTGVDADSGEILGGAIKSFITITMFLPKIGFFNSKAIDYVGKLVINSLGLPIEFLERFIPSKIFLVEGEKLSDFIPKFSLGVHKGSKGKALIIGGSIQYTGAPILSARSALRTGAGMVYLALPESISSLHRAQNPEIIFIPLKDKNGFISYENISFLLEKIEALGISAIGLGPGLGLFEETQKFVQELALKIDKPLLIDADALTAIKPILHMLNKGNIILTPHMGEMARILGSSVDEIQKNRIKIALDFVEKYNINLVLKGPYSINVFPNREIYINPFADPILATAGSGDVLSGIIVSLLSQGLDIKGSCLLGNFIHSLSAEIFKRENSEVGLIATDLIENIPKVFKNMKDFYSCQSLLNIVEFL